MVVSRVQQCIVTIMVRATVSGLAERSLARNGSICFLGNSFCGLKEGYNLCVRVITGKLCGIDECRVAFAQVWHTVAQCGTGDSARQTTPAPRPLLRLATHTPLDCSSTERALTLV